MGAPAPERLELVRAGERFFSSRLDRLADADLAGASLLPGWDRAHVVAHVARNADALGNLLAWASTGVETPMYAGTDARDAAIAATAAQPPDELRADARAASAALLDAIDGLAPAAWSAIVRTARGREVPASEVCWMRIRESWLHGVDIAGLGALAEVPDHLVGLLIDDVVAFLSRVDRCPRVAVATADDGVVRALGALDPAVRVEGTARDALAWLTGRSGGQGLAVAGGGRLPDLPRWL